MNVNQPVSTLEFFGYSYVDRVACILKYLSSLRYDTPCDCLNRKPFVDSFAVLQYFRIQPTNQPTTISTSGQYQFLFRHLIYSLIHTQSNRMSETFARKDDVLPSCVPDWAVPGTRIRIGGLTKATVRYIGSVEGQTGCWVGVEWDDVTRGKHDGCYKGMRYFTCVCPGSGGSFIRYTALCEQVFTGISLEDAIRIKYKDSVGSLVDENTVVGVADVERVLCRDGALEVIGLEGMSISSCMIRPSVMPFLSNIRHVDLSENLFSTWNAVAHCISSLPNLRVVNLSRNIMHCDGALVADGSCGHIETLILNHCRIHTRDTVRWIGRVFPNLRELYLFDNQIPLEGWGEDGLPFESLETVDLGSNGVQSWDSIVSLLGRLSNLRYLSLEGNALDTVRHGSQKIFEKLQHLNLGGNSLKDWNAIEDVSAMKSVSELRFSGNPLCCDDAARDRLLAIGRIASLTWINGSDVTPSERRDSELAFLRRFDSYSEVNTSPLLEMRMQDLEKKYGVGRNSSGHTEVSASLGSKMVHIRLLYGARTVSKKFPPSLTIDKLKRIIQKLVGIKASHQSLTLQRDSVPGGKSLSEVISQDGSKELSFFGVEQGSWDILIEEAENHLDVERINRRKSHDEKIEHQEQEARILAEEQHRLMQFS